MKSKLQMTKAVNYCCYPTQTPTYGKKYWYYVYILTPEDNNTSRQTTWQTTGPLTGNTSAAAFTHKASMTKALLLICP